MDALTGLPSRAEIFAHLSEALWSAGNVVVAFVDLDDFKSINDSLGHLAGDSVLRSAADLLVAGVGSSGVVGRLGGDEFVYVLREARRIDAEAIARRILDLMAQPIRWRNDIVDVSASIGMAEAIACLDVEELLHRADTALYESKRGGKNAFAWFDPVTAARRTDIALATSLFLRDVEENAQAGRIGLSYYPIRRIDHEECDAAWTEPVWNRRLDTDIALDEVLAGLQSDRGVAPSLLRSVTVLGLDSIGRDREAGRTRSDATNWASVPANHFTHPQFAALLLAELDGRLSPEAIGVSVDAATVPDAAATLTELATAGVRIGLHNFGRRSVVVPILSDPMDAIFLAPELIAGEDGCRLSESSAARIVAVAHHLADSVVATGVVAEHQIESAKQLGCDCYLEPTRAANPHLHW